MHTCNLHRPLHVARLGKMRGLFSANRLRVLMDRFCVHSTVNQSTIAFGAVEKFTVASLKAKYEKAVPITAVTAYDFPSAKQVNELEPQDIISLF